MLLKNRGFIKFWQVINYLNQKNTIFCMDTFAFAVSVVLMMIALEFNQNWLVFGIVALTIISSRELSTSILMIAAGVVLYAFRESLADYWVYVLFGLVIVAFVLSGKKQEQEAEMFPADPYGGMFGGQGTA